MTKRKHTSTSVICQGCKRSFGIIQQSHIDKCAELKQLGILTRAEYKREFGATMSSDAMKTSIDNIVAFNDGLTPEQRSSHASAARAVAIRLHPDMGTRAGRAGSKALWAKEGQKEVHRQRLIEMNRNGFMTQKPNKLEERFWNLIGKDRLEFASFKFWKTISTEKGHAHITPDFRVPNTTLLVEVFGDYWHEGEDPQDRIDLWESTGCKCIVIWEHEINDTPFVAKKAVNDFIRENLHECKAPVAVGQDEDIV